MVPWEIVTWLSCLVHNSGSDFATLSMKSTSTRICTQCAGTLGLTVHCQFYAVFSALVTPCSKDTLGLFGTSSIKLGTVRSISRNFTGEKILENTNKRAEFSLN